MVAESQHAPAVLPAPSRSPSLRHAEGKPRLAQKKLNSREKRFCALKVQGWSNRKAYMTATGCKSDANADVQAWRWLARPALQAAIAKGRAELTEEGALSRAEKRHHLANVVRSDAEETRDKLRAVEIDNRMTGDDDPFGKRAAGPEMNVSFFVVRVEEDEAARPLVLDVTPAAPEQLPP